MRADAGVGEDRAEDGWSGEVHSGEFFRKLWMVGSEERMWKPSLRMCLRFGEVRIVGGDKGTGVETWLGWGDLMA